MFVSSIDFEQVYELVFAKRFSKLTPEMWQYVTLSIIDECFETNYLGERDELDFSSIFNFDRESSSVSNEIVSRFSQDLLPDARMRFVGAVKKLAVLALDMIEVESTRQPGLKLLGHIIEVSEFFGGLVSGDIALSVTLNRNLPRTLRRDAALTLIDREFENSIGLTAWKRIAEDIPKCPALAAPVMIWMTNEGVADKLTTVIDALQALGRITALSPDDRQDTRLEQEIVRTFLKCLQYDGLRQEYIEICNEYDPRLKDWLRHIFEKKKLPQCARLLDEGVPL